MSSKPISESPVRAFLTWLFTSGGMKRSVFVPFGILLAAAFASSWWFHVRGSREALVAVVDTFARSGSTRVKSELSYFLSAPRAVVDMLAVSSWGSFPDADELPPIFARQLAEFPSLDIISVGLENGDYAEAQRLPDGSIRFGRAGAATGGALVLYPSGTDYSLGGWLRREGYDPRSRPWYAGARDTKGLAWSEPYKYVSNGEPAVAAARAIVGLDGKTVLGVVSATVRLGAISSFLSSMEELSGGGGAALVDRNGRVLASASSGKPLTGEILSSVGELPEPFDRLFDGHGSFAEGLVRSTEAYGKRWRVIEESVQQDVLDWRILLALPESKFLGPLLVAERRVGLIYAAAFLSALLIAFLIAHGLSLPLQTLGAAATAFAFRIDQQNDDPQHPHVRDLSRISERKDELGRLASSFAELRSRLTTVFGSLNASLAEKDVLLREIHHRVKNNLQVVSSLISLQEGKFADAAYVEAMQTLQDRVRAMAVVHETIYSSGDYVSVHMDDYLLRVTDSLAAYRNGGLDLSLSVVPGGVRLPLEQAIPCGLIAVELATNAIKHAFLNRSAGKVELCIRPADDGILLTVEDDGVGIEGGANASAGTGSLIVSALATQLKGACVLNSVNPGTRAEVRFPAPSS